MFASLEKLFTTDRKMTVTLLASGWEGDTAPFTQTVHALGLSDERGVMVYPAYGDDVPESCAMQEACTLVSYAKRSGQDVVFTCLEQKPAVDIDVVLEVYT